MGVPGYASAPQLAREALRGEALFALGRARHALAHDDPAAALTAVLRFQQRPENGLDAGSTAASACARASSLVLQALALRTREPQRNTSDLLEEAARVFDADMAGGPASGAECAEYATALVLTGRVEEAGDLAERACQGGAWVPEDVVLRVAEFLARAGASEKAEAVLRGALSHHSASPDLLEVLERVATAPQAVTEARLALVESLLEAGRNEDAVAVADRLLAAATPEAELPTRVVRVGVRLAAGATEDAAELCEDLTDDLASAPALVRLLGLALAATGRADVVTGALGPGADSSAPSDLLQAAALLAAQRPREALAVLDTLPEDRISLRLRAAASERLGWWREAAEALRGVLATAPDDSTLIAAVARLEAMGGQSDAALLKVDQTLRRRPWDAMLLGAKAAVLALVGQHAEAVSVAEQALLNAPDLAQPRAALAHGLLESGNVAGSLAHARKVLDRDPGNFEALYLMGRGLLDQGDLPEATDVLRRLERVAPWHHAGMLLLGDALERVGDTAQAREVYRRLVDERPMDADAYVAAARLEFQDWHLDASRELLNRALSVAPEDPDAIAAMAEVLRREGDPNGAETWLVRALKQQPENASLIGTLGQIRIAQGHSAEGIEALRTATERRPELAWAQAELGEALRQEGRPEEALAAFDAALAPNPDEAWPRAGRAAALLDLDRYDEALADAERSLKKSPTYAFAWAVKAHVLVHVDELDAALEAFDHAVDYSPTDGWMWASRAYARWLAGAGVDDVLSDLRTAVALDPGDLPARVGLGYALLRASQREEAAGIFTEVLAGVDDLNDPRRLASPAATAWSMLGLRQWQRAATLTAEAISLDPEDQVLHLTYGLALLCATAEDDPDEPDCTEYDAALERIEDVRDRRQQRFLLRVAARDLVDLAVTAATEEERAALALPLDYARLSLTTARTRMEARDAART